MSPEDKQRIKKEANEWVDYNSGGAFHLVPSQSESYIAGATRENERMAELLKEERNKAIDDVKDMLVVMMEDEENEGLAALDNAYRKLESLKSQ